MHGLQCSKSWSWLRITNPTFIYSQFFMNFRISDLIFRRKVLPRRDASYATQYSKGENKASPHTTIKANKKLLCLNTEELQKDVQKKLTETSERNKEAKRTLLKLDIADLKRLAKKQLMQISAKEASSPRYY